jgi:Na+/proline symporter
MSNLFQKNAHGFERVARIVVGLALLSLVFVGPQTLWGLIGLVPLFTGAIGFCPAYTLLGISTRRKGAAS